MKDAIFPRSLTYTQYYLIAFQFLHFPSSSDCSVHNHHCSSADSVQVSAECAYLVIPAFKVISSIFLLLCSVQFEEDYRISTPHRRSATKKETDMVLAISDYIMAEKKQRKLLLEDLIILLNCSRQNIQDSNVCCESNSVRLLTWNGCDSDKGSVQDQS